MKRMNASRWAVVLGGGAMYALFAAFGLRAAQGSGTSPLHALLLSLALWPAAAGALYLLMALCERRAREKTSRSEGSFSPRRAFAFILICYVPMLLISFPGAFAYDVPFQLRQVFTGEYSTHHPLLHTLLLGGCVALGRAMGQINLGAALYTILQMALLASCFAGACASIQRRCGARAARGCTLCFALYPLHMMMAVNATKDVLFSGCFALLLALALEAADEERLTGAHAVRLILCGALCALLRNNALYALAVWAALLLMMMRRRGLRLFGAAALAVVLAVCGGGLLKAATRAVSGDASEMLSWPIQQLARARLRHGDTLTQAEREAIDELMPGEAWRLYDPSISDPVKFEFDTARLRDDLPRYASVYLSVGAKRPQAYLDAVLELTYPFFYPYGEYAVSGYYLQMGVSDLYYDDWCDFERIQSRSLFPRVLASLSWRFGAQGAMQIPVIGWAFNMGLIVWMMLFFVLREAYMGRWRRFAVALLPVLLWGTFLLGPVMAGRYIYPFACAVSLLAARPLREA